MAKLKSERHHWWPECVSKHWAAEDGKTGWMKPDGNFVRLPPATLGVINNGHHVKLGRDGESSPWDESFERTFDKADNSFPSLIEWLKSLERKAVCGSFEVKERFLEIPGTDEELRRMTECATSLAIRGPMNREACVHLAESFQGPMKSSARNTIIGFNMRNSQRVVADGIGVRGKFVVIYSERKEFIYGDGFFHNVLNVKMNPMAPKILAPITPNICILVCRPWKYMVEPRLMTLVVNDEEVNIFNDAVQIYSKNAIYFRSQKPDLLNEFKLADHLHYDHPGNPIDTFVNSIPGVAPRNKAFDYLRK